MSLISRKSLLERIRKGRANRANLVASNLAEGIAIQIRAARDAQHLSQAELAEAAGMSGNNLSRLENPDYGKHSVSSLKRIADALDLALVVRFVPFSEYIDWLSGTERLDRGISSSSIAPPNFEKEEKEGLLEMRKTKYWLVLEGGLAKALAGTKPKQQPDESGGFVREDRSDIEGKSDSVGGIGWANQGGKNSSSGLSQAAG